METYPIKKLQRAAYNPRIMPESEMSALMESLTTFGFVEPAVINMSSGREGTLVGGHQRTTATERLIAHGTIPKGCIEGADGYEIPVMRVELTLDQEKALNLGLNKIKGKWDEPKLAEMIITLKESPLIPATGFREDEVSRILDGMMEEDEGEGGELSVPVVPRSIPGEIYQLGTHRLICGDATNPETYAKLLEGEKAKMVWSDPPYNVAYKSRGKDLADEDKSSIKNDDLSPADFKKLIDESFACILNSTVEGGAFYICSGWNSYPQFLDSMLKNGFYHSGVIIWVKNGASLGWNDYKHRHEWIARAKKVDSKAAEGIIYGWKAGTHSFHGEGEFDVWEMPRKSTQHYLHPTEKPDWLPMRAIRNSSVRNDIILDPFAGSGSVMAAAEKVGRRAFMIELDPKFCDVIRDRWDLMESQHDPR